MVLTKAYVIVSNPLDIVYEAVLKTCEELGIKIKATERNTRGIVGYRLKGKTGFGGKSVVIILQDNGPSTLIDFYDVTYYGVNTRLVLPFYKIIANYIPLDSGFKVYFTKEVVIIDYPTYADGVHNNKLIVSKDLLKNIEYDIGVISSENISELQGSKKLFVHKRDSDSVLDFGKGKEILFSIPIRQIEKVVAKSIKGGLMKRDNDFVVEIVFSGGKNNVSSSIGIQQNVSSSITINLKDEHVNLLQRQIAAIRDDETGSREIMWIGDKFKPCTSCNKNNSNFEFSSGSLCITCFEDKYGKVILTQWAEYHGGHKAYLAGGTFTKYEYGKLYLTEDNLIFAKGDSKDPYKRWEITIPLNSVIMDKWGIEEEGRRKIISGIGGSIENLGVAGGSIRDSGKAHHVIVPYVDLNGIPQEPRFGVSSLGGKAIRELTSKLYEQIVKQKNSSAIQAISPSGLQPSNQNTHTGDDPIRVLKLRFAKGEISKEEYEEMRKMLQD